MTAAEPGECGIPTGMEGKRDGGEAGNAGNASNPALGYPSPRAKPRLMLPENSQLPKSGWDSLPALGDPGKRMEASLFPKKPQEQPGFKRLPLPESAAPGEIPSWEWAGKGFPQARAFRGPLFPHLSRIYPSYSPLHEAFPTSIPDLSQIYPNILTSRKLFPDLSQFHLQEAFPTLIPHLSQFIPTWNYSRWEASGEGKGWEFSPPSST